MFGYFSSNEATRSASCCFAASSAVGRRPATVMVTSSVPAFRGLALGLSSSCPCMLRAARLPAHRRWPVRRSCVGTSSSLLLVGRMDARVWRAACECWSCGRMRRGSCGPDPQPGGGVRGRRPPFSAALASRTWSWAGSATGSAPRLTTQAKSGPARERQDLAARTAARSSGRRRGRGRRAAGAAPRGRARASRSGRRSAPRRSGRPSRPAAASHGSAGARRQLKPYGGGGRRTTAAAPGSRRGPGRRRRERKCIGSCSRSSGMSSTSGRPSSSPW